MRLLDRIIYQRECYGSYIGASFNLNIIVVNVVLVSCSFFTLQGLNLQDFPIDRPTIQRLK